VEGINETIGSQIVFNIPNYQTFAPDGVTVIDLGLQVTYAVLQQGPGPNIAQGDTWDTSWILDFVAESYIPRPPPVTPPVTPPGLSPAVWMGITSTLTVNADDPSPGVWMLDTESTLDVEAGTQTVGWSSISMDAETTLIPVWTDWSSYSIAMGATAGLNVTPS
jgi:hypothetical protein